MEEKIFNNNKLYSQANIPDAMIRILQSMDINAMKIHFPPHSIRSDTPWFQLERL